MYYGYRVTPILAPSFSFLLGAIASEVRFHLRGEPQCIFHTQGIQHAIDFAVNIRRDKDHITAVGALMKPGAPTAMFYYSVQALSMYEYFHSSP